jgi:hypothetical protein
VGSAAAAVERPSPPSSVAASLCEARIASKTPPQVARNLLYRASVSSSRLRLHESFVFFLLRFFAFEPVFAGAT